MHVCLVCHTEPDVWDGGFRSIDTVLPRFLGMLSAVQDGAGATPRVAWCLTAEVARRRPVPFRGLLDAGHEVGVHSHFPGPSGKLEHQQERNRDNLDRFSLWFPDLCSRIVDAGFPPPRTHASWMFVYRDSMTSVLAQAGIRAECSVCYGGAHNLPGGFLLADSRRRISGKPYRLEIRDHCAAGDSSVVELPVSGGFGDYWVPDQAGGFQHFGPVLTNAGRDRQLALFQARLDGLSPGEVDILHIHFHLYEFLPRDGTGDERLERARSLLGWMTDDSRVRFSTPSEAVREWCTADQRTNKWGGSSQPPIDASKG